jgi:predicted Ser/Thr protein kinase
MAYVEVWKNGRLITRRRVDEQKARKGCRIRIGSAGTVRVVVGQSQEIGDFEVRMIEGEPPVASGQIGETSPKPPHNDQDLPPLSVGTGDVNASQIDTCPDIKGYRVIELLGKGGMGVVWRAEQLSTRRQVAIKLMISHRLESPRARARFQREVELTARLNHPNIAQIYESGVHQGMSYCAMELIDGVPLDQYVKSKMLSRKQILTLMRSVCQAVLFAHLRAVIHRDLKPSNILVSPDGQPHVLDFGLAKALLEEEDVPTISIEGQIVGTPAYMSPEQAAGRQDQIDTRTDVFSLGVILYELLTGQPPHDRSGSTFDVLTRITEGKIRRPREIDKTIDDELEVILLTALAQNPEERYASAGALAKDIISYLDGEPLDARGQTVPYFLRRKILKYRVRIALGLAASVVLLGTVLAAYTRIVAERAISESKDREIKLKSAQLTWHELELKALGKDQREARTALGILGDEYASARDEIKQLNSRLAEMRPPVSGGSAGLQPVAAPARRIIYVDANAKGTGNGTTWANAYKFLQDGLAAAFNGDEIRVAQGTYHPDRGARRTPGDRTAIFSLVNGAALKGGYAGFRESKADTRDVKLYKTILSGDLKGDDTGDVNDPSRNENSYNVVSAEGVIKTTTLDGFTITGGYASSGGGGGMVCTSASLTVVNCTFSKNSAAGDGGGLCGAGGSPTFTGCTFEGNWSGARGGGAILGGNATLVDCVFANNRGLRGGGMVCGGGSPTLTNCTFSGNSATSRGGGVLNDSASPNLTNCTFSHNSSGGAGAGMFSERDNLILANCRFDNNQAGGGGGGLTTKTGGATLINCIFMQNSGLEGGGIFHGWAGGGNVAVINCVFVGNSAAAAGGGVEIRHGNSTITNCTFNGNMAAAGGAVFYTYADGPDRAITNCILWGDTPAEIAGEINEVKYSDVQGGKGLPWFGAGCFDADPLFVGPNGFDEERDVLDCNLRLNFGSPCRNAGNNSALPPDTADLDKDGDVNETIPFDIEGNPRVLNGIVDLGAYESG